MSKEAQALDRIREALATATQPIVLWSSGADSTVVLHLTLRLKTVPVLWFRLPQMQHKHRHGNWVATIWNLTVFDAMPLGVEEVQHEGWLDFLNFYGPNAASVIAMTTGLTEFDASRPYLCGVTDLLHRPKVPSQDWPWDLCMQGHKESDVPYFGSRQTFTAHTTDLGAFRLCNPIYDWTEQDLWTYIKRYKLPIDKVRYFAKNQEVSPDSYNVCRNCLDARQHGQSVWCPKLREPIPSVANTPEQHDQAIRRLRSRVPHVRYQGEPMREVSSHV